MAVTKAKRSKARHRQLKNQQSVRPLSKKTDRSEFIEGFATRNRGSSLQAFAAAALALPGLFLAPGLAAADEDEVDFQYSHYQESKRDIYVPSTYAVSGPVNSAVKAPNFRNPIEADSLYGHARVSLTDRIQFGFNYIQDTWAGATPIASAPVITSAMTGTYPMNSKGLPTTLTGATPYLSIPGQFFYIDKRGDILAADYSATSPTGYAPGIKNNQLTHVLVTASPETRQQGDFKLSYDWDNAAVNVGGGVSVENDYESRFGNLGLKLDFNQKRTTLNWGMSYTNSDTHAMMDAISNSFTGAGPYGESLGAQVTYRDHNTVQSAYSPLTEGTFYNKAITPFSGKTIYNSYVDGNRQDWGNSLGLTQVLTPNSLAELGLGYTHSSGYMTNPYKAVYVFNTSVAADQDPNQPLLYSGGGVFESRPHERNQVTGNLGYQYYLASIAAAMHFHYTVAHDDWGVNAHTLDGDWVQPVGSGWTVTPHVRYYSQAAADFYAPYFTTVSIYDPVTGDKANSSLNKDLPNYYSSDQRLSGFGALSGGITVTKQFAKGISLQTGFEYYTHQGSLKLGGGGEQAFADFNSWSANAALKLNLGALRFGGDGGSTGPTHRHAQHGLQNPAGVMFDHALAQADDYMVGYRFNRTQQGDGMLNGSTPVTPYQVGLSACGVNCAMLPTGQTMNMHMLELMFAPADWLTLMLMPQWMDMSMGMNSMMGVTHMVHHQSYDMQLQQHTGGIGDTGLYALIKLFEKPGQQLVLSIGGSSPTGAIDNMRRNSKHAMPATPVDYGMQLGSGTWDAKPSLTYSGRAEAWSWGAQATGTWRLEPRNDDGYKLGDAFQSSAWGGYHWTDWLSTTLRGVYNWQGVIAGQYHSLRYPEDGSSNAYLSALDGHTVMPSDYTRNYGGQTVDLGLGVNVTIPSGSFAGQTLKFEWLQPMHTDVNGCQLNRDYSLNATWSMGF